MTTTERTHAPAHLLAEAADVRTLCGIKVGERDAGADLPQMLARFVGLHRRGRFLELCGRCEQTAIERRIALDARPARR